LIYEEELKKIFAQYDEDRQKSRIKRDLRVKEVQEKVPELAKIEEEITKLGLSNFKNILENPKKSQEFNLAFQKELEKLNIKKANLLKKNNIEPDFDEIHYKCEKCLDTGYIDREKCPCLVQKIIDLHYDMSNMKNLLHDFSEFSFDYYKDEKIEKLGLTQKENAKEIFEKSVQFCNNENSKNLLFYGGCGLGKTFLSSCVAKKMLDDGKSVIYETATSLCSSYEDYKFGKTENDFDESLEVLYDADLLIIDDLGTEVSNPISSQFFLDIVNKRVAQSKKIIISTNLTIDGLRKKYTERLISRFYESFEILNFVGSDIRIQKLVNSSERK